jgi:hypothetical protein
VAVLARTRQVIGGSRFDHGQKNTKGQRLR